MKRVFALMGAVCVLCCSFSGFTALAADTVGGEPKNPSNVTITVVMPDTPGETVEPSPNPAETAAPAPTKVYPTDVTEIVENGDRQIIKTYMLSPGEAPEDIPRESFERSGWRYSLTDIIRRETANAETRAHTEIVTLYTDTKELEQIMNQLAPKLEYKDDDGFVGVLTLDVSSIKVEAAGTQTSSFEVSVTREYPHLSDNDTSLLPKTVTDRGTTYTLAGVNWQAGNYSTVDYERIPDYYNAYATYTATSYSTKVTGYVTTAEYGGSLARLAQGKTIYIAYFLGTEVRTPLETVPARPGASAEPSPETMTPGSALESAANPTAAPVSAGADNHGSNAPLIIILVVIAAGVLYCIIKLRKKDDTTCEKS